MTEPAPPDRHARGMAVRRAVLGDAHVNRAEAAKTPLDAPFQDLITEAAWGTVWASDAISRRERSMLTLALLAATGEWLGHALKKNGTLVEKNIAALAGLLQLNQAERALLLYGTLAR
ncbi:MAG: carboxymuconolactone decarboxylase family protein, partial [Gemmobacter sp.]